MIVATIIIAYIANVFLNRWLNKIMAEKYSMSIVPFLWWTSLLCTIVMIGAIIGELKIWVERSSWFTGKYWDDK